MYQERRSNEQYLSHVCISLSGHLIIYFHIISASLNDDVFRLHPPGMVKTVQSTHPFLPMAYEAIFREAAAIDSELNQFESVLKPVGVASTEC